MPKVRMELNGMKFDIPLVDELFTPMRLTIDSDSDAATVGPPITEKFSHGISVTRPADISTAVLGKQTITIDIIPHPEWSLVFNEFGRVVSSQPPSGDDPCPIHAEETPKAASDASSGSSSPSSPASSAAAAEAPAPASPSATSEMGSKPSTSPASRPNAVELPPERYALSKDEDGDGWVVTRKSDGGKHYVRLFADAAAIFRDLCNNGPRYSINYTWIIPIRDDELQVIAQKLLDDHGVTLLGGIHISSPPKRNYIREAPNYAHTYGLSVDSEGCWYVVRHFDNRRAYFYDEKAARNIFNAIANRAYSSPLLWEPEREIP